MTKRNSGEKRKEYVIIGGGVAAVGCIEGIRSVDADGGITLISGEDKPVYCRPLISYYLQGKTDPEKMKYRPDAFYSDNGCTVINATATGIDKDLKKVTLSDGQTVGYDSLCVAAGSAPFVPPFEGLETVEKRFGFMTEDDAFEIEKTVCGDSKVFIVGAGLIGLKCAEGLADRVGSITVCDIAPRVLSSILDDDCASIIRKKLEEHGISFMLGDSAVRFEKNTAYMKSGKTAHFDVLVLAVGVRANSSLVRDAGGVCDRGIIVDKSMHTSLEEIYAAGDCAQGYDASTGENRVLAILPNAYMQGRCAGVNMGGGTSLFDSAIPMNAIGFYGFHALTAGSYDGKMYEYRDGDSVKRLFVRDGVLVGFMLLGEVDKAGIYTAMIRNKTPIDENSMEMLKKSPSLLLFSPETRRNILGGVV